MVELFLREAVTMKDFRHTHVLALTGVSFEEDGSPMVVLPYMANGDLRSYIQQPSQVRGRSQLSTFTLFVQSVLR